MRKTQQTALYSWFGLGYETLFGSRKSHPRESAPLHRSVASPGNHSVLVVLLVRTRERIIRPRPNISLSDGLHGWMLPHSPGSSRPAGVESPFADIDGKLNREMAGLVSQVIAVAADLGARVRRPSGTVGIFVR
jgi:hypothetical protein